jgi:metallo-beta-lactamase class B
MHLSRRTCAALSAALCLSIASAHAADWNAPQEPFQIYGNTWYVGTHGISAVLITSPAGHILLDAGSPQAPAQVAQHIRQLGFRVEDVRYILNSHAHIDHAGGIAALQALSRATVLAGAPGEQVLRTGRPGKGDPQYANLTPLPAVANTRVVHDGDVIELGPIAVTAHATPGHTKGGFSWTWRAVEGGVPASIVYADSLNAVAAGSFRYSRNTVYPNARRDVEQSIAAVAALDCDILVSAHPEASGLWLRKDQQAQLGNRAFIDPHACQDYAAQASMTLAQTLAAEAAPGKNSTAQHCTGRMNVNRTESPDPCGAQYRA